MYAKIENNQVTQYPLSDLEVRLAFPNTSFPQDLAGNLPDGYVRVLPVSQPNITTDIVVTEGTPELKDGFWIQTWVQSARYTPEELEAEKVKKLASDWENFRGKRNLLLEQSDWVVSRHRDEKDFDQVTSISDSEYLSWLDYRKQLRNATIGLTDPNAGVLPTPPGTLWVA
jgi:hypothetical protein